MLKKGRAAWEGYLILLFAVMSLIAFWYIKGLIRTPGEVDFSPMSEEEFVQNRALGLPEGRAPVNYTLDAEGALFLLGQYKTPDTLTWEVATTVHGAGRSRTVNGIYTKTGDDFQIQLSESGNPTREFAKTGKDLAITTATGGVYRANYTDNYKPTAVLGMADVEFVLTLSPDAIVRAGMEALNGREVLYIEYVTKELKLTEKYWISLDYGLPLRVETYDENELIYLAETVSIG